MLKGKQFINKFKYFFLKIKCDLLNYLIFLFLLRIQNICFFCSLKRFNVFKSPSESPTKKLKEDVSVEEVDEMKIDESETPMESMEIQPPSMEEAVNGSESPSKEPRVDILKWTVSFY